MKIDCQKLEKLLSEESESLGIFCETSFFIGEINGYPVKVAIMTHEQAEVEHDYISTNPEYNCMITESQANELDALKKQLQITKAIKGSLQDQQIKLIKTIDNCNLEIQTINQSIKRISKNE